MAENLSQELTGVLAQIAEATDEGTALKVAQAFGGREIHIPVKPTAKTKLGALVGVAAAEAIAVALGPGELLIPLGPTADAKKKTAAIVRDIDAGFSNATVAGRYHVHERTVRRIRKRLREAETPPLLALLGKS